MVWNPHSDICSFMLSRFLWLGTIIGSNLLVDDYKISHETFWLVTELRIILNYLVLYIWICKSLFLIFIRQTDQPFQDFLGGIIGVWTSICGYMQKNSWYKDVKDLISPSHLRWHVTASWECMSSNDHELCCS